MIGSWLVFAIIILFLLGGCSVVAGGVAHWPSSLAWLVCLVPAKMFNDRYRVLAWPMEFLLFAGVALIVFTMVRLYFMPLPY